MSFSSTLALLCILFVSISIASIDEDGRRGKGSKGSKGGKGNKPTPFPPTPPPFPRPSTTRSTTSTTRYAPPSTTTTKASTTSSTGTGTTSSGEDDCSHRHRKSWAGLSQTERDLYIDGFKALADKGITQQLANSHHKSAQHSNSQFLPWHRQFIYIIENEIRALGGKFECFAMPYWDWTDEPTPNDLATDPSKSLLILNSGLGGDSNGKCLKSGIFADYVPYSSHCLTRDLDYSVEPDDCSFNSASSIMQIIDSTDNYARFRPTLESRPHALAHICIGGDLNGQMATFYSPDDPIFFLHHTWIDYIWALWQDCHNYDDDDYEYKSYSQGYSSNIESFLEFKPYSKVKIPVKKTFDIVEDYDVSYEKGAFWNNAFVDSELYCGANTETNWFYDEDPGKFDGIESNRGSDDFSAHSFEALQAANPDKSMDEIKTIWAQMVCEYEEIQRGICEIPIEYDDCSSMALDPTTNDIVISKEELLKRRGITTCMEQTVGNFYEWAAMTHTLKDLCAGCYAPFCDKSFLGDKCGESSVSANEWMIADNDRRNAKEIMKNVDANVHILTDANNADKVKYDLLKNKKYGYFTIGVSIVIVLCLCVTVRHFISLYNKERRLMADDDVISSYNAI